MILRFSLNEILEDKGLIHVPPEPKGKSSRSESELPSFQEIVPSNVYPEYSLPPAFTQPIKKKISEEIIATRCQRYK